MTLEMILQTMLKSYNDIGHVIEYKVITSATHGNIGTKYFGEGVDADKVETDIKYRVFIYPPESVKDNGNATLHLQFQRISLKTLESGKEQFVIGYDHESIGDGILNYRNFTPPGTGYNRAREIILDRLVPHDEVKKMWMYLDLMPGFNVSWFYSGVDIEVDAKYSTEKRTKYFVRDDFMTLYF